MDNMEKHVAYIYMCVCVLYTFHNIANTFERPENITTCTEHLSEFGLLPCLNRRNSGATSRGPNPTVSLIVCYLTMVHGKNIIPVSLV